MKKKWWWFKPKLSEGIDIEDIKKEQEDLKKEKIKKWKKHLKELLKDK
jgi:formate-dependent nitrite reductase cytochrome c552 subunit